MVNQSPSIEALAGRTTNGHQADVESDSVDSYEAFLDAVDRTIRNQYESPDTLSALKTIGKIRERLERSQELGAARSRILLGTLSPPTLAATPEWFTSAVTAIRAEDVELQIQTKPVLAVVENLIRAIEALKLPMIEVEQSLEIVKPGRVMVEWRHVSGRLRWLIDIADTAWPALKVYEVTQQTDAENSGKLVSRVLFNALDAIESFREFFGVH